MRPLRALLLAAAIFATVTAVRALFFSAHVHAPAPAAAHAATPQRIVSLAPSITEVLFALGLGDRVVGVTRYCEYPPEAQTRAIVGGFVDANYEAIVELKPDLVGILAIHDEARAKLASLSIPVLSVDHRTIGGILDSFIQIADHCGVHDRGANFAADLQRRMDAVDRKTQNLARPRVLISSAREFGTGRIESVYAAGRGQWYDELLKLAGGENAYPDDGIAFPEISPEGILRINPDIIIELAPKVEMGKYTEAQIVAEWNSVPGLRAAQEKRIHLLTGSHVAIPGPRFVQVLEDFARILHPEIDWSAP
jgi:iron complex transport system substrate-binding protein